MGEHLNLQLSEEKTCITHMDDGFDFLGYHLVGGKRWSDGQWCLFARVPKAAMDRTSLRISVEVIRTVWNRPVPTRMPGGVGGGR